MIRDLREFSEGHPIYGSEDLAQAEGLYMAKAGNRCLSVTEPDEDGTYWTCTQPKGHKTIRHRAFLGKRFNASWLDDDPDEFFTELGL